MSCSEDLGILGGESLLKIKKSIIKLECKNEVCFNCKFNKIVGSEVRVWIRFRNHEKKDLDPESVKIY